MVLESRAQGAKKMGLVVAGSFVVGLLVMMVLNSGFGLLAGVPVLLIGGAIVHHIYYAKGTARYRSMFKVGFLAKLVKAVEPGVDYVPEQGISEAVFNQSGLFGASPDRYTCEDLIHGMIGDTKVMLSEVHAKEKHTSTDSKGRSQTRWKTIFKGIFFFSGFPQGISDSSVGDAGCGRATFWLDWQEAAKVGWESPKDGKSRV